MQEEENIQKCVRIILTKLAHMLYLIQLGNVMLNCIKVGYCDLYRWIWPIFLSIAATRLAGAYVHNMQVLLYS